MTPIDEQAYEEFMRVNNITSMIVNLTNSETYHCWFDTTSGKFRYHKHSSIKGS